MRFPYIKVVFISIMHQWIWKREFHSFFLWVWLDKAKSKRKNTHDDGGPLEQPKQMIFVDSSATPTAVQFLNLISPTPQPQELALTRQCDIWLHVAYGVKLVLLLISVNCIYLAYTWYVWIWHAFLFLVHTISVYHTMFLHETTLLVYPASVTYDGTPLSWLCDIGLRLKYDF